MARINQILLVTEKYIRNNLRAFSQLSLNCTPSCREDTIIHLRKVEECFNCLQVQNNGRMFFERSPQLKETSHK